MPARGGRSYRGSGLSSGIRPANVVASHPLRGRESGRKYSPASRLTRLDRPNKIASWLHFRFAFAVRSGKFGFFRHPETSESREVVMRSFVRGLVLLGAVLALPAMAFAQDAVLTGT